jgi:hypothetical protein
MKNRINEEEVQKELSLTPFFKPKKKVDEKSAQNSEQEFEHKAEQVPAQKAAQVSKLKINSDDVETLDFELRKTQKTKFNADIPVEWKQEIDRMALDLNVGKYELGAFLIARALKKVG